MFFAESLLLESLKIPNKMGRLFLPDNLIIAMAPMPGAVAGAQIVSVV
jgi:hypothetical protein